MTSSLGPFPGINSHQAQVLMVRCMDFRFQEAFNKFLEARNFRGCDVVGIAGGVLDYGQVEKHVEIAVKLHQVETVVLVNHRHCGAYGQELQADPEKELAKHKADLLTVGQKIKAQYPHLEVETWFAEIAKKDNTLDISFVKV